MTINWDEAFNSPRPQHLLGPRPPRHTRRLQPLCREGKALASPHICHLKSRLQQTTWGNDGHRTPALNQGGLPPPPKKREEAPLALNEAPPRRGGTPLSAPPPPWRCPRPLHPSSRPGGQPPATRIQGLRLEDLPDASVGRAIPPVSNKKCQGMAGRRPAHGREPLAMKDGHRGPVHRLSRVDEEPRQAPPLSRRQPSRAMASVSLLR